MMKTEKPELPDGGELPVEAAGGGELHPQAYTMIIEDPLYLQALELVQRGQWSDAEAALAELELRYPGDPELARVRRELSLHLSAERTWLAGVRKRPTVAAPRRTVLWVLLVANAVLYGLVGVTWLLLRLRQLFR